MKANLSMEEQMEEGVGRVETEGEGEGAGDNGEVGDGKGGRG